MALIIPPGYAQIVLGFAAPNTVTGRTAVVLGFGDALGPDPTSLAAWLAAVEDNIAANVGSLFDQSVTLDTLYAQTAQYSDLRSVSIPGNQDFQDPPPNVAVLVNYGTAYKGRRGRGRSFLYGVTGEGDIDSAGNLGSGRRQAVEDNWVGITSGIATAADPPVGQVILQNTTPTTPPIPANPTPPITPPPFVTTLSVSGRVATQRRRLRR